MNDQIVQRDKKRRQIKRTRRNQIFKRLISSAAILAVVIFFLLLFQLREIQVKGTDFLTENEVREYIHEQGEDGNSLVLLLSAKFGEYPTPPTVKSMEFHMVNPWTIRVEIREKEAAGYARDGERYIYFDDEGLVLGITESAREGVSLIEGLDVSDAEQGKKLKVQDSSVFEYIVQAQEILERSDITPDRIVCDGENITLFFGTISAELGSGDPQEKVAQLPAILPKLEGQSGTLHLEHYGELTETISFEKTETQKE